MPFCCHAFTSMSVNILHAAFFYYIFFRMPYRYDIHVDAFVAAAWPPSHLMPRGAASRFDILIYYFRHYHCAYYFLRYTLIRRRFRSFTMLHAGHHD